MNWNEFLGNDGLRDQFLTSAQSGRAAQSYLITGPAGSGKRTFAGLMAKTLLCRGDVPPCNRCEACRKVDEGIHPDFIVLTTDKKSFSVDQVRALRDTAHLLPNEGARKVTLIPDAHLMTPAAQNAFLKVFEEPPPFCTFILTAVGEKSLLPVILSRAVKYALCPLQDEQVESLLRRDPEIPADKIPQAVRLSAGCAGFARALALDPFFDELPGSFHSLLSALSTGRFADFLQKAGFLETNKGRISEILSLLELYVRDLMIVKAAPSAPLYFDNQRDTLVSLSRALSQKSLLGFGRLCRETGRKLEENANFNTALTSLLIESWEETH